jgi:hypothetical protein
MIVLHAGTPPTEVYNMQLKDETLCDLIFRGVLIEVFLHVDHWTYSAFGGYFIASESTVESFRASISNAGSNSRSRLFNQ